MRATFSLLFILIFGVSGNALNKYEEYKTVRWWMLQDVTFEDVYNAERDEYYLKPIFGDRVLALNNEYIEISGYVIPVDITSGLYVLSAYPFSACYFCGGAGPESVVQMEFKGDTKEKFKTDDYLTFKGKFSLNSTSLEDLNYILKEVEKSDDTN